MPNLEPSKVLQMFYYSAIPIVLTIIIYYFFLNDSPRNLIINNENEKAFIILERIAGRQIHEPERRIIVDEIIEGENKKYTQGDIKSVFNEYNLLTSILLIFLWFFFSLCLYAPYVILSLTLKKLNLNKHHNIFIDESITFSLAFLGYLLPILSEVNFIGRKRFGIISFALMSLILLIATFVPAHFNTLFAVSGIFTSASVAIVTIYSYEFYSTKIRELANGFLFSCTRIGGFSAQFLGIGLDSLSTMLPYYTIVGIGICSSILFVILPHETYGHHLDVNIDDEETQKLKDTVNELEKQKHKNT